MGDEVDYPQFVALRVTKSYYYKNKNISIWSLWCFRKKNVPYAVTNFTFFAFGDWLQPLFLLPEERIFHHRNVPVRQDSDGSTGREESDDSSEATEISGLSHMGSVLVTLPNWKLVTNQSGSSSVN